MPMAVASSHHRDKSESMMIRGVPARVAGLLPQGFLQILDSRPHFVDVIGLLGEQVFHHAHALVERLLHAGHVVLHELELGLDLYEL